MNNHDPMDNRDLMKKGRGRTESGPTTPAVPGGYIRTEAEIQRAADHAMMLQLLITEPVLGRNYHLIVRSKKTKEWVLEIYRPKELNPARFVVLDDGQGYPALTGTARAALRDACRAQKAIDGRS